MNILHKKASRTNFFTKKLLTNKKYFFFRIKNHKVVSRPTKKVSCLHTSFKFEYANLNNPEPDIPSIAELYFISTLTRSYASDAAPRIGNKGASPPRMIQAVRQVSIQV